MVSSSKPTVLTQYPLAQKFMPVALLLPRIHRWILTALFPFKNPIVWATLYFGGIFRHMCTWSGIRCPSSNSTLRCRHRSRKISPTFLRNFPYSFFCLYFGTNTTWYLQSHRTCDKLYQSCIGSFSDLPWRGFPGG